MKVLIIKNDDLGCQNILGIYDSWESAAFENECQTVEIFKQEIQDDSASSAEWVEVETLPTGCATLKEAQEVHWG